MWERFGNVPNYVEPFFGSGAVLFHRPYAPGIETINDKDGFVANFWRAVQHDPEGVARHAENPVNENDLHARHSWLVGQKATFLPRLEGDPEFYDVRIAGWWVWGISCWIGSGFCSGNGPWGTDESGQLVSTGKGEGIWRQRPHLMGAGQGIKRGRPHLGNAGMGINRQLPYVSRYGQGINRKDSDLLTYFSVFADRLRHVRVCCGDWQRVCGPTPTFKQGLTGVFLDPPYSSEVGRDPELYREEDLSVAHEVRAWAIENGENSLLRIALCGYEGEHDMPSSWAKVKWRAWGGYSNTGNGKGKENATREVIWFSAHCLQPQQRGLFT